MIPSRLQADQHPDEQQHHAAEQKRYPPANLEFALRTLGSAGLP
jgi:hypothetical protein